jgi:hypothetical protein
MKTYGLTHEQLAMVSVVQREWPAMNPRATLQRILGAATVAAGFESTTSRLADGRSLGFVKVGLGTSPPRSPMSSLRAAVDGTGAGSR